jgi:hypothetical protein
MRCGLATSALIELNDIVCLGVKVLAIGRLTASPRATMDDHNRDSVSITACLPGNGMEVSNGECPFLIRLTGWVKDIAEGSNRVKHELPKER